MGSRLRPIPDKIFECLVEVTAPVSESEGAKLASFFPENYEDVKMLEDVVTKFCFPFAHDAEMVDAVQHFAFVLTDIDGLFRFGFCRYPPRAKTCLCILSDLPAFEMFYGILNTLAELENKPKKESVTSKQFLDLVLESRVPEPGTKFTVSEPGSGWMRQYNYPDPGKLPSIPENRNLTDYFSAVNPNNMISLFASMMCERRIIVTSKKLSLLTACAYSASLLLYPMHWQHVFIPVIPSSLLDYCSAPMPFLVGVHSSLMKKVRDMPLDDVVILDIDKQEIELHGDTLDDVDYLPQDAVSKLNNALKKTTIAIGEYVARAFLSAVVILIGGYRDALKLSNETIIVFEQDLFINSRPHMKSFLENLLKLQLFERFIHHRLEQLNSGEGIDDVFEEQVGLQTESDSKWVSQYKQWMKNRKRHGTQLLNSISGKTEKATSKAKKFMFAGVKNVKNHGKNGFREAMKGLKEIIDHKSEKEVVSYDNVSNPVQRSSSLPMRRVNAVKPPPQAAARQSIGSIVHDRVNQPPPSPTRSPRPRRQPPGIPTDVSPQSPPPGTSAENAAPIPPPRIPTDHSPPTLPPRGPKDTSPTTPRRPPPRPPNPKVQRPACPPPYQPPKSGSVEIKMRPSMLRHPGEPDVRDLINFYDSQEDLTCESPANNHKDPFGGFHEFNYLNKQSSPLKMNGLSTSDQSLNESEGLLSQTMCALSDDTRQFLRHSRIMMESENRKKLRNSNPSLDEKAWDSPRFQRKPPVKKSQPAKKTLREIAVEQKLGKGHDPVLTHASSAPSLFDPLAGNMDGKSSSDIDRNCNTTSNGGILQQVGFEGSKTDDSDPFLAISQRHRSQQQGGTTAWVANFK